MNVMTESFRLSAVCLLATWSGLLAAFTDFHQPLE